MGHEFHGAVVWLPEGSFDHARAIAALDDQDWSDHSVSPDELGTVTHRLARALGRPPRGASDHDSGPGAALDAVAVIHRLAALSGEPEEEQLASTTAASHAHAQLLLLAVVLDRGGDTRFSADAGEIVVMGATDTGGDYDRSEIWSVEQLLRDEMLHEALIAGGAVPPARWSLGIASGDVAPAGGSSVDQPSDMVREPLSNIPALVEWASASRGRTGSRLDGVLARVSPDDVELHHVTQGWDRLVWTAPAASARRGVIEHADRIASLRGQPLDVALQFIARHRVGRPSEVVDLVSSPSKLQQVGQVEEADRDTVASALIISALRAWSSEAADAAVSLLAHDEELHGRATAVARLVGSGPDELDDVLRGRSAVDVVATAAQALEDDLRLPTWAVPPPLPIEVVDVALAQFLHPGEIYRAMLEQPPESTPALIPLLSFVGEVCGVPRTMAAVLEDRREQFVGSEQVDEDVRETLGWLIEPAVARTRFELFARAGAARKAAAAFIDGRPFDAEAMLPPVVAALVRAGEAEKLLEVLDHWHGHILGYVVDGVRRATGRSGDEWSPEVPPSPQYAAVESVARGDRELDDLSVEEGTIARAFLLDDLVERGHRDVETLRMIVGLRRRDLVELLGGPSEFRSHITSSVSPDARWLEALASVAGTPVQPIVVNDAESALRVEGVLLHAEDAAFGDVAVLPSARSTPGREDRNDA